MSNHAYFLRQLSEIIVACRKNGVLRVAINGVDGAGKTILADELAEMLRNLSVPVIRSSIDGFHNPRAVRYRLGRRSPEGFYHDSFNMDALVRELLAPLSNGGSLMYRTAVFDHRTDSPVIMPQLSAPNDAVLIVDGIFLFVPKLLPFWDLKVFLDVPFRESYKRMAQRDGSDPNCQAESNRRYLEGQKLYIAECIPERLADVLIDYSNLENPEILRPHPAT